MKNATLRKETNCFEFNIKVYDLPNTDKGLELGYVGRILVVTTMYKTDAQKEIRQITKEWSYASRLGAGYSRTYKKTIS